MTSCTQSNLQYLKGCESGRSESSSGFPTTSSLAYLVRHRSTHPLARSSSSIGFHAQLPVPTNITTCIASLAVPTATSVSPLSLNSLLYAAVATFSPFSLRGRLLRPPLQSGQATMFWTSARPSLLTTTSICTLFRLYFRLSLVCTYSYLHLCATL